MDNLQVFDMVLHRVSRATVHRVVHHEWPAASPVPKGL